jgi:general secretion pathway protein C
VLAYWTWALVAPRPAPVIQGVDSHVTVELPYDLFGGTQRPRGVTAPTGLAIKLLGVVAASGHKNGYAVLQIDGAKILAAREGQDIAPGIRLAEVQADQIVLERNGVKESLALPDKNKASRETRPVAQQSPPVEAAPRRERD